MESCNSCLAKFTKCCLLPQRLIMAIMTSLAIFTSYTVRAVLSIAITEMVVKSNKTIKFKEGEFCGDADFEKTTSVKDPKFLYNWSEKDQGFILAGFYFTYIITHVPGALLAERFGGKHVMGTAILINNIISILTPMIITYTNGSVAVMVTLRAVIGLGQGMVFPVATAIMAQWMVPHEKGFISSLTFSGGHMATVVANTVGGVLIMNMKRWDVVFYLFGGLGLVWNFFWQLMCYSYPRTHPCLKEDERVYLEESMGSSVSKAHLKTPWKSILTSVPVWGVIITQFGHDWGFFTMVTDLPKYMSSVQRFDVQSNGIASSIPYLIMWICSLAAGYVADVIIDKNWLSLKWIRLIFGTLGQTGPAIFMQLATYVGCAQITTVAMFTLAMFFMGFYYPGARVNPLDLSPNFAGTIMALVNGIGVFAGILAPLAVGFLTTNQYMSEWQTVFWINFGMMIGTNVIYVLCLKVDVQEWNHPKEGDGKDE